MQYFLPRDRVVFVTESEASVHFTLFYSAKQQSQWLAVSHGFSFRSRPALPDFLPFQPQSTFAVVDAGGSTVDICVYNVLDTQPKLKLREAKTSDCVRLLFRGRVPLTLTPSIPQTQSGGIFVSRAAEEVIKAKLGASRFNEPEFVRAMVNIVSPSSGLIIFLHAFVFAV